MRSEEKSPREPLVAFMGNAEYHHLTFPGENPYYNVNYRNDRRRGDSITFLNNTISLSPLHERAVFKPDRNYHNTYGFKQQVVNW